MGTPRVGEIYLPILHPSDMCSAKKINNPQKMFTHLNCTAKLTGKNTAAPLNASGDINISWLTVIREIKSATTSTVNLLVYFAFDWSLHRSPKRPYHPAADLREKKTVRKITYRRHASYV